MPLSRTKQVEYRRRCAQVMDLYGAGMTFYRIGEVLNCHESTAARMFHYAMDATLQPAADEYRNLVREQIRTLLKGVWAKAAAGDNWAVDRARMLIKDLRELDGLDAPVKTHVTISDAMIDEIERLSTELGVADPDRIPTNLTR